MNVDNYSDVSVYQYTGMCPCRATCDCLGRWTTRVLLENTFSYVPLFIINTMNTISGLAKYNHDG